MATLKLNIDRYHVNQQGKVVVRIEVGARSKMAPLSLDVWIDKENWDAKERTILPFEQKHKLKNKIIYDRFEEAEKIVSDLQAKGKLPNNAYLIRNLIIPKNTDITLLDYFNKIIERYSGKTKDSFQGTYNLIYGKYKNKLFFEDIDAKFLRNFENWYLNGGNNKPNKDGKIKENKINGLAVNFRNLRRVFNLAIEDKIISADLYPFRTYKIKREETAHRNIDLDNFKKIMQYEGDKDLMWAKHLFLLSFCLIGINMKDLFFLNEIDNGYIFYNRFKTKKLYHIKLEPEAIELISLLKGKNSLFNFSEQYKNYTYFIKGVNRRLERIAEELNIKKFTTYYARHSWATFASDLEIPESTISAALGHSNSSVTRIYINFDKKKITIANRQVIDYICQSNN